MSRRFVHAYWAQEDSVRPFLPLDFARSEARAQAVRRASERAMDPKVLEALRQQNAQWSASSARDKNLDRLGQPGTVVVATGQQVGLFLGPLYTLYKAATTVSLARTLTEETGVRAVPLFWLQTEDHDHPEVATANVPRSDGSHVSVYAGSSASERTSMAQRVLEDDLDAALSTLTDELAYLPHAEDHLARVKRHYQTGAPWAKAFAGVVAELFADTGLILLDPRDARFAAATVPVHRTSILKATPMAEALIDRAGQLEAADFGVPIYIRPQTPLSFFHPDGPEGPRYRLKPVEKGFGLVGGDDDRVWSTNELLARLEQDPLAFSTSALLRPILQDTLLPTAVYVGGPGEIDYFAQMGPLYDAFQLPVPLIVPRGHFRVVEDKTRKKLDRLGLVSGQLHASMDELLAKTASASAENLTPEALQNSLKLAFSEAMTQALPHLVAADPALKKAVDKTVGSVDKSVSKLVERYQAAVLRKDQGRVQDIERLKSTLFPNGAPQERFFTCDYFIAKYGASNFLQHILDGYRPFTHEVQELCL